MAKKRNIDAEELLSVDRALRKDKKLEGIRTTVTDKTLIAIRSSTGKLGPVSGSYTVRRTGDAQLEIFAGRAHFSWPFEVREGDSTKKIIQSIRTTLSDYLDGVVNP